METNQGYKEEMERTRKQLIFFGDRPKGHPMIQNRVSAYTLSDMRYSVLSRKLATMAHVLNTIAINAQ